MLVSFRGMCKDLRTVRNVGVASVNVFIYLLFYLFFESAMRFKSFSGKVAASVLLVVGLNLHSVSIRPNKSNVLSIKNKSNLHSVLFDLHSSKFFIYYFYYPAAFMWSHRLYIQKNRPPVRSGASVSSDSQRSPTTSTLSRLLIWNQPP